MNNIKDWTEFMDLLKIEMMIMNHQINNITNQIESITAGHECCVILMVSLLTENIYVSKTFVMT